MLKRAQIRLRIRDAPEAASWGRGRLVGVDGWKSDDVPTMTRQIGSKLISRVFLASREDISDDRKGAGSTRRTASGILRWATLAERDGGPG